LRIVLVEPEIPQNTGSIARLAAATRTPLDLVGPLGFSLEDRYLRRAGLDYWPLVDLTVFPSWQAYLDACAAEIGAGSTAGRSVTTTAGETAGRSASEPAPKTVGRALALSARAQCSYTTCRFRADDRLLFGKETKGLAPEILEGYADEVYAIPIAEPGVRSLNLSNAVSIVVYEARRQLGLA